MAQSTLNNFFPTVKKQNPQLFFPKSKPQNFYFSFFSPNKPIESQKKTTIPDFFPKKSEISVERSPRIIEKTQRNSKPIPKSPFKPNLLIKWLRKDQKPDSSSWTNLPKELIMYVMQFLTIKENSVLASVCKYYRKCFDSIWFSYDFFGKFNFNTFTTGKQLNKVFEKASRLCHIKKMKNILTGKKVDAFIKRTKLSTTLAKNRQNKGNEFEEFSIEPRIKGVCLFLTDKEIIDICGSSKQSLMFISLMSCHLLTEKSFKFLAQCENLQNLAICKNSFLKDENITEILRNCKHLKSLNLSGCSSLTDRIHEEISIHCQRIEILELAEMPQLTMDNFYKISSLSLIKKLNISYSSIENEVLQRFLSIRPENIKNLEWLNMDSCHFLNKETIVFLCYFKLPPRLKYLNLAHNMNFVESDIWKLVFGFETLVDLVVETHLLGEQIREKLAWNRIFAEQQMNSAFMSISK